VLPFTCYEFWNLTISAFVAIGTIAAAIVALYLANRQDKVVLKASVYKAVAIGAGTAWPESLAITIINRSKFPVSVDGIGWTLPKSPRGLSMMLNPGELLSNGIKGVKIPFTIEPGEKSPLFSMPWRDFENSLRYMACNDKEDVYHQEVRGERIKFYVSTPRADNLILFDVGKDVMSAFVDSLKYKDETDGNQ